MKRYRHTICGLMLAMCSCTSAVPEPELPAEPEGNICDLSISVRVPGTETRGDDDGASAVGQKAIDNVVVMLFKPGDEDARPTVPKTLWRVLLADGVTMDDSGTGKYRFDVRYRVNPETDPVRLSLVTLANAADRYAEITAMEGKSYGEVQRALTSDHDTRRASFNGGGTEYTMWGISTRYVNTLQRAQALGVTLIRDLAKVSVMLDGDITAAQGHTLASLTVYNRTDGFHLMPRIDLDGNARLPSVPTESSAPGSVRKTECPADMSQTATPGGVLTSTLPEQEILMGSADGNPDDANRYERPALIVGLNWKGGSQTYYYRLDFTDNDELVDVMRNHHYIYRVKSVNGPGCDTEAEAYHSLTANIEAEVKVWEDFDNDVALDGGNWVAMAREVTLGAGAGSKAEVTFLTNVESNMWQMAWGGAGADHDTLQFSADATVTDADGTIKVTRKADGESGTLTFETLKALPEDVASQTLQLFVDVTPRLRLVINVTRMRQDSNAEGNLWDDQNIYIEF